MLSVLDTGNKSHSSQAGTPEVTQCVCISDAQGKQRIDVVGLRGCIFQ